MSENKTYLCLQNLVTIENRTFCTVQRFNIIELREYPLVVLALVSETTRKGMDGDFSGL